MMVAIGGALILIPPIIYNIINEHLKAKNKPPLGNIIGSITGIISIIGFALFLLGFWLAY